MTQKELVKGLGLVGLIASVFNCTVGGGIFRLPSSVYKIVGAASPIVYLVCFIVMLLVVTVFVQVGRKITVTGGPYAYVQPVLGPYFGFICGVLLWCLATFAMASVGNAYAHFAALLFTSTPSATLEGFILAATLGGLAYFNIKSVKAGSSISVGLSIAKLLPLLALLAVGLPHLDSARLALPPELDWNGIARGAMILIFAYTGVESALIPSGEIQNPEKNLPRALYSALILVLFLYVGVQVVSQSILGADLADPNGSPLAMSAERLMGPGGKWLLMIGATFSTLGYLSAMTLSLPRTLYAFAVDGYLPRKLAEVDPVHATPSYAIVTQVAITWLLAVSSQFERLAVLANLSAIAMYLLCAVAAFKLKTTESSTLRRVTAVTASLAMLFLLTSVTRDEWLSVGSLILISSVGYYFKNRVKTA